MKTANPIKESYLRLLRRFPLRPLRSEAEYDQAAAVLQELFMREDLDEDQQGYVDTLAMLIQAYDAAQYDLGPDARPPAERLRSLVRESGMSVNELGEILGSQSAASMVLSGRRGLSKTHIRKLSERFRLDPGYFF